MIFGGITMLAPFVNYLKHMNFVFLLLRSKYEKGDFDKCPFFDTLIIYAPFVLHFHLYRYFYTISIK